MKYCIVGVHNPNKMSVYKLKQIYSSSVFVVKPFDISGRDISKGVCIHSCLKEHNFCDTENPLDYWFYFDNFLSSYEFLKFLKSAMVYNIPPDIKAYGSNDFYYRADLNRFKYYQEFTFWIDFDYSIESLPYRPHARSKACWENYCSLRKRVPALNSVSNQTLKELFLAVESMLDDYVFCSGLPSDFIK